MPDSFYGGRYGASFVIVTTFATIDEMVAAFKKGPNYTDVHFDEYVLINTEDRLNEENGQIYKRGYEYTNDLGGAIYIGTIAGPAGASPQIELATISDIDTLYETYKSDSGYSTVYSSGSYTTTNESLVNGKESSEIQWVSCSIRDESGLDTTVYLGFKLPYLVNEFTAVAGSAYSSPSVSLDSDSSTPFYNLWELTIPQGIQGADIRNLRVTTLEQETKSNTDVYASYDSSNKLSTDNISSTLKIFVYDVYDHSQKDTSVKTVYLGTVDQSYGILIGGNVDADTIRDSLSLEEGTTLSTSNIISYLNTNYTGGLDDTEAGKIITVGDSNGNKEFYAYDYNASSPTWYLVGRIDNDVATHIEISSVDDTPSSTLIIGGIQLAVSSYSENY